MWYLHALEHGRLLHAQRQGCRRAARLGRNGHPNRYRGSQRAIARGGPRSGRAPHGYRGPRQCLHDVLPPAEAPHAAAAAAADDGNVIRRLTIAQRHRRKEHEQQRLRSGSGGVRAARWLGRVVAQHARLLPRFHVCGSN